MSRFGSGLSPGARRLAALAVVVAALAAAGVALAALRSGSGSGSDGSGGATAGGAVAVSVGPGTVGRPVAPGFVGLSLEYSAVPAYAGSDPSAVNPVFAQLLRNLAPGQSPVLRIGGDSTDRTWYPVPGIVPVGGIRYTLSAQWLAVTKALAQTVHARLVLGLNMEANRHAIADAEARAFVSGIGSDSIAALEPGNEPELYGSFPWYQSPPGHGIRGRAHGYGPADFTRELSSLAPTLPRLPLAGPATGAPKWFAYLKQFVAAEPRIGLLSLHRYATRGCFVSPDSPQYHTVANLLSTAATHGLAETVAPYMNLGPPVRIDELGSVNCGGVTGVSDTFAAALWSLDVMFELARVGASGVNFHTFPGAKYEPFAFTRDAVGWQASVKPMYYGLMMFAQAAAPGSRLLTGSGDAGDGVTIWALRAPDGTRRVVLINFGAAGARTAAVRMAGSGPHRAARLVRLSAPSARTTSGVTLGGRSFGAATRSGVLGAPSSRSVTPTAGGYYVVRLPAASAAMLTMAR